MEFAACVIHVSASRFPGEARSFRKYLALWKTWRSNVNVIEIEKVLLRIERVLASSLEPIDLERVEPVVSLMVIK